MKNRARRVFGGVLMLVCGVLSGCGKTDSAPPVATVSLTLSKKSVNVGSVLDLTYRFQVAEGARINGDYRVFVHVTREDGTSIWNDDHELADSQRTSRWQPGQTIEYTRTRFVPALSYLGPATIEVGLYKDDERLPLAGPNSEDRESRSRSYKVATLELLPRSEDLRVVYLNGWHQTEYSTDNPTVDWQWTQKVATLSVRNPKRDAMFFLEFDTRPDLAGKPQQVSVYCGDTRIATFTAGVSSAALQRIPVTAAQLGSGEMVEFRIEVDPTFVPAKLPNAGNDIRELGIRVHHLLVEPK